MIDLGSELKEKREENGISLAEAEAATRIKARYLKALETNDWAALPTKVQARGFLRNYAIFLGLDEGDVMSKFSQVTRSAAVSLPPAAAADSPVPTTNTDGAVFSPRDIAIDQIGGLPGWFSSDIIIGVVLALVVAALGFGLLRLVSGNSDETSEAATRAPGFTPVVTESPSQSTAGAGTMSEEAALATPTFDLSTGTVQLSLQAGEHVWVRVTVDGTQVLEGILVPGEPQTWQGRDQIIVETANAAGLNVVVNGQPQGPLGERGEAVFLAWGPSGLLPITPTPLP